MCVFYAWSAQVSTQHKLTFRKSSGVSENNITTWHDTSDVTDEKKGERVRDRQKNKERKRQKDTEDNKCPLWGCCLAAKRGSLYETSFHHSKGEKHEGDFWCTHLHFPHTDMTHTQTHTVLACVPGPFFPSERIDSLCTVTELFYPAWADSINAHTAPTSTEQIPNTSHQTLHNT